MHGEGYLIHFIVHPRFRSIAKSYFRRADGVLLLYDCTYERSFLNIREWMDSIEVCLKTPNALIRLLNAIKCISELLHFNSIALQKTLILGLICLSIKEKNEDS